MDTAALAALVSKMQDRVQEVAAALKKVATIAEVDIIAADLDQLVFEVEDAMRGGGVANHVGHADNTSVAVEEEASSSKDIDDDDVVPADWSPDQLLCLDDGMSIESDRSWRL